MFRIRLVMIKTSDKYWEITVAQATPATPIPKVITNNRLKTTLTAPETLKKIHGPFAVPRGPQNGRTEIVDHAGGHAQKNKCACSAQKDR